MRPPSAIATQALLGQIGEVQMVNGPPHIVGGPAHACGGTVDVVVVVGGVVVEVVVVEQTPSPGGRSP